MDDCYDACIERINSSNTPVTFESLKILFHFPEALEKDLLSRLTKSSAIFSSQYSIGNTTVYLFWRKDIRDRRAEDSFIQWEKQSAIV